MQSAENPSQLSVHTYEESGTLLNIADLSACLQNPDTANWENGNISFVVQGDYLYFYGYDFGEDAGEKPIYSVLAKIDGETCTEVDDFEQSTASFVPSYTAKADGFLFAFRRHCLPLFHPKRLGKGHSSAAKRRPHTARMVL